MNRSGDVTAAAIVLFFGSALLLLMAAFVPFAMLIAAPPRSDLSALRGLMFGVAAMYFVGGAWGIVTGVGVIQRRPWGRICMVATGIVGVCFAVFGSAGVIGGPLMMQHDPRTPPGATVFALASGVMILLVPLAVSIWWLVLFTRRRVTVEFSAPVALPAPLPGQEMQREVAFQVAGQVAQTPIPLSIRVIAYVQIVMASMGLLGLPFFTGSQRPPVLIFGFMATGWASFFYMLILGIVPVILCIAILRRKAWSLDALVVFLFVEIVNLALFLRSPMRPAYNAALQETMNDWLSHMRIPNAPLPEVGHAVLVQNISFVSCIVLFVAALYFLFTRRSAFRAACSHASAASVGEGL
jgi:hypothetical protein